jgi:hypothetical protein
MRTRLHNIKQVVSLKGIMVALEEDGSEGVYVRRGDQWHHAPFFGGKITSIFAGDDKLLITTLYDAIYEAHYIDLLYFHREGRILDWRNVKAGIAQAKEKDNE